HHPADQGPAEGQIDEEDTHSVALVLADDGRQEIQQGKDQQAQHQGPPRVPTSITKPGLPMFPGAGHLALSGSSSRLLSWRPRKITVRHECDRKKYGLPPSYGWRHRQGPLRAGARQARLPDLFLLREVVPILGEGFAVVLAFDAGS